MCRGTGSAFEAGVSLTGPELPKSDDGMADCMGAGTCDSEAEATAGEIDC